MRGSTRRRGTASAVPARQFGWDRALLATIRHVSLPFEEAVELTPLVELRDAGARDRLSLLGQFAAHQALLQFAGLADGELDPSEWSVVRKRGLDVRLVRTAARSCDATSAPPVLTIAQQFAEQIGASLDVLSQPWARADAIYAEAFLRVARDVAADLRWLRLSACGAIASPGVEGIRTLAAEPQRYACDGSDAVDAIRRFAELDGAYRVVELRGSSPLARYSALQPFSVDRSLTAAAAAERVLAATSREPHVFVVSNEEAFDEGSRQVADLLSSARHGTWLIPRGQNPLPETRDFLIAPRLRARAELRQPVREFVQSAAFTDYIAHGDVPAATTALPPLAEPARSYIGALALLGSRVHRSLAERFLADFLFHGAIEELLVGGVTSLDGDTLTFSSDAVREEAVRSIPVASRPAICRVAASHATGITAVLLWLDAGDPASASEELDRTACADAAETVRIMHLVPRAVLSPSAAARLGHALVDCGRYRDARDVESGDELVLARAERRMGDYATALARLERIEPGFDSQLLRAEVLRLLERDDEARLLLRSCEPGSVEEATRLAYEHALHGEAVDLPSDHYLATRYETYRALERGHFPEASDLALESHRRARTTTERIDASLDRLFAVFSAGEWDAARAVAVEALQEVEETQGDRAAGGILFTLAYLAADDGQWAHASQRIARLRHYYTSTRDEVRLAELQLLTAHLDFSRGRFAEARRGALAIYERRGHHDQIREAAALILDELDWMDGTPEPLRSTGRSGNEELRRRHLRIRQRDESPVPAASASVPAQLFLFRRAFATGQTGIAREIASRLDLVFEPSPAPAEVELRVLRAAATREFPFAPHDFDRTWCFSTRNRLGHWSSMGTFAPSDHATVEGPDWIRCSDHEVLFLEGSSRWTPEGRDAVSAIFRMRAENHRYRRLLDQEEQARPKIRPIDGIVGQSQAIREVEALVERIARRDVPVCILGESGTGKELVARAIHRQSPRRQKPFTAVNCAALPENLVESELFGHVRGAFTGADRDRAGLIETTDGGTLFLDEIGELPLPTQAKLLRFLQEGEFRRVGDTTNRAADVRIVSATNRKLDTAVEEGRFRDDLYYRVRGVEVVLPPLRERGADLPLLATHFIESEREKHRAGPATLSDEVTAIFSGYSWPGNVRELQNTIRAAHAMAGDARQIELEHLPARLRAVAPSRTSAGSYQQAVTRFKRDLIERSLVEANGNQNRAAASLKMSRQALAYQIRELGILVK